MAGFDEFESFLETWEPSERLKHATLSQNINDPYAVKRLFDDCNGSAAVERTKFASGTKIMVNDELAARAFDFFKEKHAGWSDQFKDYVLSKEVPLHKYNVFVKSFASLWVDGRKRRQNSPEMQAIKVSIRDLDCHRYPNHAGKWVVNSVDNSVTPLFTIEEMGVIFDANNGLIEALLPDYIDCLGKDGPEALSELYVRRGVCMPCVPKMRRELNYLSSYSLALGPVEQFAQTYTSSTKRNGNPSIFSAPISAVQHRVVAFAPFIEGMDLAQLEFVVAPSVEETSLQDDGMHGEIREFSFL
ncbi:MAG: hypothetical protein KUG61_07975 [Parvibaculaceae bacterium]|nr:hypothetical protein [Parvibaculaceae bacterium]